MQAIFGKGVVQIFLLNDCRNSLVFEALFGDGLVLIFLLNDCRNSLV